VLRLKTRSVRLTAENDTTLRLQGQEGISEISILFGMYGNEIVACCLYELIEYISGPDPEA
jgi:hypothetical protein